MIKEKTKIHKIITYLLGLIIIVLTLAACGNKTKTPDIKTKSSTQEDLVSYFKEKGYIADEITPIDINETTGYLTDNSGGEFKETAVADVAYDYDGLWIFWWNQDKQTDRYETYDAMKKNAGTILLHGGALILQTEAQNGAFAIAFAEDYEEKEAVLADFKGLPEQ
jgi:hypothetical protein